ncbi:LacI family DNA-binding transcriptional regulator [Specibacter cremeus]|uniref:LacI family DNA-binding transcriptional regulator n=1 Tax=Specibacter cremeus TaxID=1629051 RepID=UPI000F79323A|nr:LacI family DNA-binding transcriptional regulator [Specibacter cremeus]
MSESTPRRRDVTVADVAREARVSKAQAARALGGYGAVSDDVRERVMAAAEHLNYRPNELARTMNTGKSNTLGVVVGDIENPHFGLAMRGISDVAKAAGFDVILINTSEDVAAEVDAVRVLLDKRVDGLIVAPASRGDSEHLGRVLEAGRPLVLFDRKVDGLNVDVFAPDMTDVARESTEQLIAVGHRRIAFISTVDAEGPYREGMPLASSQVAERLLGMHLAFRHAGLCLNRDLIRLGAGDSESIAAITEEVLADGATAIVASDGLIALSVIETIQRLGLSIPDDVSFLMYDDFAWTKLTSPPLSVIAQPVYDIGAAAARAVILRIRGQVPRTSPEELKAVLVERGSIGAATAGDRQAMGASSAR